MYWYSADQSSSLLLGHIFNFSNLLLALVTLHHCIARFGQLFGEVQWRSFSTNSIEFGLEVGENTYRGNVAAQLEIENCRHNSRGHHHVHKNQNESDDSLPAVEATNEAKAIKHQTSSKQASESTGRPSSLSFTTATFT